MGGELDDERVGIAASNRVDDAIVGDWLDGRHRGEDEFHNAGADPAMIAARAAAMVALSLPAADRLVDGFLEFVASS